MISNFKAIVVSIINCVFSCMNLFWQGWESLTILCLVVFLYFIFFPAAIYKKLLLHFLPGATPDKETNRKRNRNRNRK
jgi:hypothetical protein